MSREQGRKKNRIRVEDWDYESGYAEGKMKQYGDTILRMRQMVVIKHMVYK